jgi:hypothetical protein
MLCGNYGVNRSICKDKSGETGSKYVGTPLNLSQISHPGSTLLVVDSGYSLISWQGVTDADVTPCEKTLRKDSFYVPGINANKQRILSLSPYSIDDAINGRHRLKTVNVGYVDNHAKQLRAEELFVPEENGVYTNVYQTWASK